MGEKNSEFGDVLCQLEKAICQNNEYINRLANTARNLGAFNEKKEDSPPDITNETKGQEPSLLDRLSKEVVRINESNSYLLNVAINFERMI